MFQNSNRNRLILLALSILGVSPVAAQVTVHLTTTDQETCTAVTDAQGLSVASGGTDLQATGVTLTGTGCGGASADFGTSVNVPASVQVGTQFNVDWSTTAVATQCVYGGTAGMTNWPVGQVACQGGNCAGTHSTPVTINNAGSHSFSMFCTNATGQAQTSTTATGAQLPPSPANFALTPSPAAPTVGDPVSVSWSVSGATTCQGSATADGAQVTLTNWTNVTTPASPRTVTFPDTRTYVLQMTCANAHGSVQSQPLNVTPQAGNGDSCPPGRQLTADVCYSYSLGSSCANGTQITDFKNIWGRNSASGTPADFPGPQYFAIFKNMQRTGYVAAKFTVPATGLPSDQWGLFTHGETLSGPNLTMSISQQCGDFSPSASICLRSNQGPGASLTRWKLPTNPAIAACEVVPGQSYFVNIKLTDPQAAHNDCSSSTCTVTVQHNHTP